MEEDILRLQAQTAAYGLVLRVLIQSVWNSDERVLVRDHCCEAVEQMYARMKVDSFGHAQLQAVMHDVEELFRMPPNDDKAIPHH